MAIVLYDYVVRDERGLKSVLTEIDIPPEEYKRKLALYGLEVVSSKVSGSIDTTGADTGAWNTNVVKAVADQAVEKAQSFFEQHREAIVLGGLALVALAAFHYGKTHR